MLVSEINYCDENIPQTEVRQSILWSNLMEKFDGVWFFRSLLLIQILESICSLYRSSLALGQRVSFWVWSIEYRKPRQRCKDALQFFFRWRQGSYLHGWWLRQFQQKIWTGNPQQSNEQKHIISFKCKIRWTAIRPTCVIKGPTVDIAYVYLALLVFEKINSKIVIISFSICSRDHKALVRFELWHVATFPALIGQGLYRCPLLFHIWFANGWERSMQRRAYSSFVWAFLPRRKFSPECLTMILPQKTSCFDRCGWNSHWTQLDWIDLLPRTPLHFHLLSRRSLAWLL